MNLELMIMMLFLLILVWEITLFMLRNRSIKYFIPILTIVLLAIFRYSLLYLGSDDFYVNLVVFLLYAVSFICIFLILYRSNLKNDKLFKKNLKRVTKKTSLFVVDTAIILSLLFFVNSFFISSPDYSRELNVYDWGDYFAPGVLDAFAEEYDVKINYDAFDDEYDMYYNLLEGDSHYDVAFSSDALIDTLIAERLIKPINSKSLNNINNLDKKFYSGESRIYGLPYTWGTTGIAVNKEFVIEEVDSWSVMWNPQYKDKIAILDNPDEVIVMVSKYVSGNLFPNTYSDSVVVKEFINLELPLSIVRSDLDSTEDMLLEKVWIAHTYNGQAALMAEENPNIEYVLPKEGFSGWVDYLIIPEESENYETAILFLDYILRPEVAAEIVNYQFYASANKEAKQYVDEEILFDETIYIPDEEFLKMEFVSEYYHDNNYLNLRDYVFELLRNDEK